MAVELFPSYVTELGPATGRIHGTNHLALVVDDMDASVRFYRDLLGFKVVRTASYPRNTSRPVQVMRTYFFDIGSGDGMLLAMYEVARDPARAGLGPEPTMATSLWPGTSGGPVNPRKMDHLAFNVDTHDDLVWFQGHLRAHGVEVPEITVREVEQFVESIYFYDPSRIPLEIATFDWDNPRWNNKRGPSEPGVWLRDTDPVPSLRTTPESR
jgi:catechol 2,3-dioxygenase-like lactoylglutathione lyase family enzyme